MLSSRLLLSAVQIVFVYVSLTIAAAVTLDSLVNHHSLTLQSLVLPAVVIPLTFLFGCGYPPARYTAGIIGLIITTIWLAASWRDLTSLKPYALAYALGIGLPLAVSSIVLLFSSKIGEEMQGRRRNSKLSSSVLNFAIVTAVGAALGVGFTFAALKLVRGEVIASTTDRATLESLRATIEKQNATLPRKLDDVLEFTSVTLKDHTIVYTYTLADFPEETLSNAKERFEKSSREGFCANPSIAKMLSAGIELRQIVNDQSHSPLFSVDVRTICGQ
jgi:hypothetical protein